MKSIYSRKNSGGPGYIKGSPVLAGNISSSPNGSYVSELSQGF